MLLLSWFVNNVGSQLIEMIRRVGIGGCGFNLYITVEMRSMDGSSWFVEFIAA